ncbi:MAG: AtpZ/AtpI family protein [bacterium]
MKKRLFFSFQFLGKVAVATVLPLSVFVLSGRFLDNKLGTSPYLLIAGVAISLLASILWLRKISVRAVKQINDMN